MSRPEVIAAELRAAAGVGKGISRTSSLEPVDGNSPRMTRSTSRPLLIPDLSAEKALAVSDPLAAIRSLRSKLRNSPAQDPELEDLEKQLAAEREKNRSDRERRRQDHKKLHVDRRATISTWNNKIGESMAKLKQWERDSQIRIMQRESERELDREKYQTDRKLEMEKRRRTVRRRQIRKARFPFQPQFRWQCMETTDTPHTLPDISTISSDPITKSSEIRRNLSWTVLSSVCDTVAAELCDNDNEWTVVGNSLQTDMIRDACDREASTDETKDLDHLLACCDELTETEMLNECSDGRAGFVNINKAGGLVGVGVDGDLSAGPSEDGVKCDPGSPLERRIRSSITYLKQLLTSAASTFSFPDDVASDPTLLFTNHPPKTKLHQEKKYVLQTAEFYGADFSAPTENPEIAVLHHRNALDGKQLVEQEKERVAQGSVFINALTTMALNRAHELPEDEEDNLDASVKSALEAQAHPPPPPPPPQLKSVSDAMRQQVPSLDYSDIFPDDIVHREGVTMFRIEALKPIPVPKSKFGKFCVADCYIVLENTPKSSQDRPSWALDDEGDAMEHKIWVWIGSEAEVDKRFCAAMFGTGLRNWSGANGGVERECPNEESVEFQTLFGNKFAHVATSEAAESGLFVAQKKRYPLRLYMIYGNREIKLRLLDPAFWSLKSDAVFLLDWGMEIYQWNGTKSRLHHRAKCRILASRINRLERVGRASIEEVEEWSEPPRFWEILGGQRTEQDAAEDHEADARSEEALFKRIAEAPATLYKASEDLSGDLSAHVVSKDGKLSKKMLATDGAYVLDAGVELFLWIGKGTTMDLRGAATELVARVVPVQKRPKWVGLNRLMEGAESEIFIMRFKDWEESTAGINWEDVTDNSSPNKSGSKDGAGASIRVDVRALYTAAPPQEVLPTAIEDTVAHANSLLQSFTSFVYQRGRFVQLPDDERGHFFTDDAYVFLCVYRLEEEKEQRKREARERKRTERRKQGMKVGSVSMAKEIEQKVKRRSSNASILNLDTAGLAALANAGEGGATGPLSPISPTPNVAETSFENDDSDNAADTPEPSMECLVYFWHGRMASKLAFSTFKFKTQQEMENLVQEMYGCSVRIVHLDQGKEPVALLAHLDNSITIHRGSRAAFLDKRAGKAASVASSRNQNDDAKIWTKSQMFHIRVDHKYRTARAVEVYPHTASLVSRDCFYIRSLNKNTPSFLWRGKGASKDEVRKAEWACRKINTFLSSQVEDSTKPGNSDTTPTLTISNSSTETFHRSQSSYTAFLNSTPTGANPSDEIRSAPQGLEPSEFFTLLAPPHGTIQQGIEYYYVPPPRFLRCSCAQGYFSVEEVTNWSQVDLKSDTCIMVDPGAPRRLWVWVGKGASDVVKKLCRKSVEVWLERLDDGRACGIVPGIFGPTTTQTGAVSQSRTDLAAIDDDAATAFGEDGEGGWRYRSSSSLALGRSTDSLNAGSSSDLTVRRTRAERAARKALTTALKTRYYTGISQTNDEGSVMGLAGGLQTRDPSMFNLAAPSTVNLSTPGNPEEMYASSSYTGTNATTTSNVALHHYQVRSNPSHVGPGTIHPGAGNTGMIYDAGDVAWTIEGEEPGEFTSFFCGWDERPIRGTAEIGNAFLSEQGKKKRARVALQQLQQQVQQQQQQLKLDQPSFSTRHESLGRELGSSGGGRTRKFEDGEGSPTRRQTLHF